MKYRVDFPIRRDCDLQCFYCFHIDYFEKKHPYDKEDFDRGFTLDEWVKWRDKFLVNPEEILLNLHGGETFHRKNIPVLQDLMTYEPGIQTYDLLSNGLVVGNNYRNVLDGLESKIKRIGFTFHREIIKDNPDLIKLFESNVLMVKSMGIPVYVKELLRVKDRHLIVENKKRWFEEFGIELKVQDYKGDTKGATFTEYSKYSGLDHDLIDEEYHHIKSEFCTCIKGYKTLGIRGYEPFGGDVVACWQDPVIVGNIRDYWFNNNYNVDRLPGTSVRNVIGVPKKYAGTFVGGKESREDLLQKQEEQSQSCKH